MQSLRCTATVAKNDRLATSPSAAYTHARTHTCARTHIHYNTNARTLRATACLLIYVITYRYKPKKKNGPFDYH